MTRDELAKFIDHTLLRPEATSEQVRALCDEANRYGVAAVCVTPSMLPLATGALFPEIAVCCVVGFPSGAIERRVKAFEAALGFAAGAAEIDMVINLGLVATGRWDGVAADIEAVRSAVPSAALKVIIESASLTDAQIIEACRAAEASGANFVKTSTGFHPAGGASTAAVELMRRTVGDRLGVKASGGIRDTATALAMIGAGATRLGTSATLAILQGV